MLKCIVDILTYMDMINTISETGKAKKAFIFSILALMSNWSFVLSLIEHEKPRILDWQNFLDPRM